MSVRLDLSIDELVLVGCDPIDTDRLGRALERSLARLLGEHGIPDGITHEQTVSAIVTPPVALAPTATPEAVAMALARAIYDGLSR